MRNSLYIKEVAKLVGVTTKTVRHYHKIGLLPEPERTDAGYRLYSGWDLWRLRTICELRRLGLSLNRIRTVLDAPEPVDALRSILATQLDEIATEMVELAERKERIQNLMSQEHINVDLVNGEPELYTDKILAQHAKLMPTDLDQSLVEFERGLEQSMAAFPEHDGRDEVYPQGLALIEENPEQYKQWMHDLNQLWTQITAIETLNADAEETIAGMVDAFVKKNQAFLKAMTQLSPDPAAEPHGETTVAPPSASPTDAVFGEMASEQMGASLTPAQMHMVACISTAADAMRAEQ